MKCPKTNKFCIYDIEGICIALRCTPKLFPENHAEARYLHSKYTPKKKKQTLDLYKYLREIHQDTEISNFFIHLCEQKPYVYDVECSKCGYQTWTQIVGNPIYNAWICAKCRVEMVLKRRENELY